MENTVVAERVRRVVAALGSGGGSARALEALAVLRREILSRPEGARLVREAGGLERLVSLLKRGGTEQIFDGTLSALATSCLEDESSLIVGKLGVAVPLVSLVRTVSRDSVLGRACRLLGNLAQQASNAESLHAASAVSALLGALERRDNHTSYPTLAMLIRAIRLLWMVTERREDMLGAGAVRAAAMLLTAECEAAGIVKVSVAPARPPDGISRSQEELFAGLLKCLGYFTTLASVQCAEQLQGDGRGYQCLVALTRTYESTALKCLMNLCFVSSCRPLLGTAGFVECLVGVLQKRSDVEWWPEGSARALAQLSGEAVNRSRLRHCGGLPLLVAAARRSQHAMHALLQYVFDDTAFQILINEGLVTLLTEELTAHLATMECEHDHVEDMEVQSEERAPSPGAEPSLGAVPSHGAAPSPGAAPSAGSGEGQAQRVGLLARRKSLAVGKADELKVVIERDNMIVGFMDAVESEASDDSGSEGEGGVGGGRRTRLKRARSTSPQHAQKSQLIKMAKRDWSASIYWEPKSPEWPSSSRLPVPRAPAATSPGSSHSERSGRSPECRSFASQSKRPRCDWSPDSGVGSGSGGGEASPPYWAEYQWSPASSGGCGSPCSANDESSDSEVSGRYSPVCSEPEAEAEEEGEGGAGAAGAVAEQVDLNAAQMLQDLDDLIMEDDETVSNHIQLDESASGNESACRSSRIGCVLVLLFRASHGAAAGGGAAARDPAPAAAAALELLARRDCLAALLEYVERCKRPLGRAAKILARVLGNALTLTTVLRSRLALRLHRMSVSSRHPTAKCRQCKQIVNLSTRLLAQLTVLAESEYGTGEICYQLLKGHPSMKQTLSVTLPYFVKTEKPLRKFFIECSALNMLFTSMEEARETLEECVPALARLAASLRIKDPKSLERRYRDHTRVAYDPILDDLTADDVVTFQLDDASTVDADKVFLCQNSEVFHAMLKGRFKESGERRVRMKKVTKAGLEYVLTLLQCGMNGRASDAHTFPLAGELATSLEALLLADRFLLERLRDALRSAIVQFQLSPETAERVYVWSLAEGMGVLCVEAVAYLLAGRMPDADRTRSFTNILALQYKQQWLDDVKSVIMRQFVM